MQKPAKIWSEICAWAISINTHQPEGKQCCRNGSSNSTCSSFLGHLQRKIVLYMLYKIFHIIGDGFFSARNTPQGLAYGKDTLYHRATSPAIKDARVSNYDPFLFILWLFLLVEKYHLNLIMATILYAFIKIQFALPLKMIKFCYKLYLNRSARWLSREWNGPCLLPTFRNLWSHQDPCVS